MSNVRNNTLASSNNEYFDLFEYTEQMPVAYVAAQVAQSTAWRIDTMLVAESRKVFKHVREELFNTGGGESYSEITAALHEAEFAEHSFAEAGLNDQGTLETIRALNAQRDQWHDLATELTSLTSDWQGQPRVYVTPDIETIFHKEPNMKVSQDTQRRLRMSATRTAETFGGDAEMATRMYERKYARQQSRLGQMAENLKDQAGAVYLMYQLVLRGDESSAAGRSKEFYMLPLEAQRTLLQNAAAAAARADEYASTERNMSDFEYDTILGQALKVQADIKKLLDGHRFVTALRIKQAADALV